MTYRIKNWAKLYENHDSRKLKSLEWIRVPNKHDGRGLRRLMRMGERGMAIFGAWMLVLQVASKMPVRGLLADDDGPLTAEDIADKVGAPAGLIVDAMTVLISPEIGWVEIVEDGCNGDEDFRDVSGDQRETAGGSGKRRETAGGVGRLARIEDITGEERRREENGGGVQDSSGASRARGQIAAAAAAIRDYAPGLSEPESADVAELLGVVERNAPPGQDPVKVLGVALANLRRASKVPERSTAPFLVRALPGAVRASFPSPRASPPRRGPSCADCGDTGFIRKWAPGDEGITEGAALIEALERSTTSPCHCCRRSAAAV